MAIITLTTDFGSGSPYVAEMKGAILSLAPHATIVDVTHDIAPQDIMQGALALRQIVSAFPKRTIHVAVVDPGVGTNRSILLVHAHQQFFIAPDNGLVSLVMDSKLEVREVDRPEFWRAVVSSTFHGRDIMGPVAAHLASGVASSSLSSVATKEPVCLKLPLPTTADKLIRGEVLYIDSFGNLVTNISADSLLHLKCPIRVTFQSKSMDYVLTYAAAKRGETIALVGSSGLLEIAVSGGNAQENLKAGTRELVFVHGS